MLGQSLEQLVRANLAKKKKLEGIPGRGNSMGKAQRLATNSPYVSGDLKQ